MNAYDGQGRSFNQATYTGTAPALVTQPTTTTILNGEYSDPEPLNNSQETTITITFTSVPTSVTTIEYDADPMFANAITLDTLPASATDKIAVLTITQMLPGFVRIKNTSDKTISLSKVQKLVRR